LGKFLKGMHLKSRLDAWSAARDRPHRELVARAGRLGLVVYRERSFFGPSEYTVSVTLDDEACVQFLAPEQVKGLLDVIEWRDAHRRSGDGGPVADSGG
jgi:hypothetical protein